MTTTLTSSVSITVSGIDSSATVNSAVLHVYSDSDFTTEIDSASYNEDSFAAGIITYSPSSTYVASYGANWAIGSYFKLLVNVTNSNSKKNHGVCVSKISAIEGATASATTCDTISLTGLPTGNTMMVGDVAHLGYYAIDSGAEEWHGAVTYTSSNTSVATVDSDGVLTALATGTTTVSVADTDGNATDVTNASATITVTAWVGDLTIGSKYILVCDYESTGYALTGKTVTSTVVGTATAAVKFYNASYELTVEAGSDAQTYSFLTSDGYLGWTSENSFAFSATKSSNYSWHVSLDAENNATITNSDTSGRAIQYNYNNGKPRFATYTGGQTTPKLLLVDEEVRAGSFVERFMRPGVAHNVEDSDTGACKDSGSGYYTAAKTALVADEDMMLEFQTNATFVDYVARYEAWAAACGDTTPYALGPNNEVIVQASLASLFNASSNSNNTALVIVISLTALSAAGGYFLIRRRKEN